MFWKNIKIERKKLELEIENFERQKEIMRKELELKYQYDRKELENEWHCEMRRDQEKQLSEFSNKMFETLEKIAVGFDKKKSIKVLEGKYIE